MEVKSPDNQTKITFFLTRNGMPAYQLFHKNKLILDTSTLGFTLKNAPPLKDNWENSENSHTHFQRNMDYAMG